MRRLELLVLFFASACLPLSQILSQESSTAVSSTTSKKPSTSKDDDELVFDSNSSYCFHFTWMGPEYDLNNKIPDDYTCEGHMDDGRSSHFPCKGPLVISEDGTFPNTNEMWEVYKMKVACKRTKTKACVKWSHRINNEYINVTFMCATVFDEAEGAVRSGCFKQMVRGTEVEICICESINGLIPCNSSTRINIALLILFIPLLYIFI